MNPADYSATTNSRFTADGFLVKAGDKGAYSQFYSTGQIEVFSIIREWNLHYQSGLFPKDFEGRFLRILRDHLTAMKNVGVVPPILISVNLKDVGNCVLADSSGDAATNSRKCLTPQAFQLPEKVIHEWSEVDNVILFAKPLIDVVWNAAGLPSSPFIKEDGTHTLGHWDQY